MGVASKAQLQAAKADALAAANKTGRHRRVLTKKKLKHERNQVRHKRKKEKETTQRGRSESASAAASASTRRCLARNFGYGVRSVGCVEEQVNG
eukprot:g25421.t1